MIFSREDDASDDLVRALMESIEVRSRLNAVTDAHLKSAASDGHGQPSDVARLQEEYLATLSGVTQAIKNVKWAIFYD